VPPRARFINLALKHIKNKIKINETRIKNSREKLSKTFERKLRVDIRSQIGSPEERCHSQSGSGGSS